jgi:hypothetical protein
MRRLALLLLLALGCESFGPAIPEALVPFRYQDNPLGNNTAEYYPQWWAAMEACSGLHRSIDHLEWLYWPAEAGRYIPTGEEHVVGHYDRGRDAIWIVERGLTHQTWIEHEMLHALLPEPGHHQAAWDRCGVRLGQ